MKDINIAINKILMLLFPNRCEICGEVIELNAVRCDECENPPSIKPPLCTSCGCSRELCTCKKNKNEYKQIIAPFYYEDTIVKGVNRFKNHDMPFLAKSYAAEMYSVMKENYGELCFDYIVYIPMTKRDTIKRGYNQSELLARELSALTNIELSDTLIKTERTKQQKALSARERRVNLYGSFDLKDKAMAEGKTFLLVDDIKTTGSTLNECAKMLKIYGAKAVYAITLALVNNSKPKHRE